MAVGGIVAVGVELGSAIADGVALTGWEIAVNEAVGYATCVCAMAVWIALSDGIQPANSNTKRVTLWKIFLGHIVSILSIPFRSVVKNYTAKQEPARLRCRAHHEAIGHRYLGSVPEAPRPIFFKQWGGVQKKRAGRILEGRTWDEMPIEMDLAKA